MYIEPSNEQPQIPQPTGDDQKEVFAFIGFATYTAHRLEAELINLVVALRANGEVDLDEAEVDRLFMDHQRRTMGQLVGAVRTLLAVSADEETCIALAVEERNRLAHRFFREHAQEFFIPSGRRAMIDNLRAICTAILAAEEMVSWLSVQLWSMAGVNKAVRESEAEALKAKAEQRDAAL